MIKTLKLYWILNPPYQRKGFLGISAVGVVIAQLLFLVGFDKEGSVSFGSLCYCAYFLFLSYLSMYNFMNSSPMFIKGGKSHSTLPLLLQMNCPKNIFVKGIILNDILICALYFLVNIIVISVLSIDTGFHIEIVIATLWASILACTFGILLNLATHNGKGILSGMFAIFYITVFFLSSLWLKSVNSLNNDIMKYITQVDSLLLVVPVMVCVVLVSYYVGVYCYMNRRESKKRR